MGFWCKLFGHVWKTHSYEGDGYVTVRPSDWCTRCGITKEDLRNVELRKGENK